MKRITLLTLLLTISCSLLTYDDPDRINGVKVVLDNRPLPNATAVAIYPFVFVQKSKQHNRTLINHENIHLEQYKELLWIGFPIVYAAEYIKWWFMGTTWLEKESMALEREAYDNDQDPDYLKNRIPYAWTNY